MWHYVVRRALTQWILRVKYGVVLTQLERVLDAAEFSDTHSSLNIHVKYIIQATSFGDVSLNLAPKTYYKHGLFQAYFYGIFMKSCQFSESNSAKLVGDVISLGQLQHFIMVQQVSYVYEKFPIDTMHTLAGLDRALVELCIPTIQKRRYYAAS